MAPRGGRTHSTPVAHAAPTVRCRSGATLAYPAGAGSASAARSCVGRRAPLTPLRAMVRRVSGPAPNSVRILPSAGRR
jgi:hypothetical protein